MSYHNAVFALQAAATIAEARSGSRFTPVERAAVRIGAADCLNTLGRHPRWIRLKSMIFGFRPANPLADPSLEALRRLVVELRHARPASVDRLMAHAVAHGVPREQAAALARRFTGHSLGRGRR